MIDPGKITILYVDDEDSNVFIFKVNFESKYPVLTARSGLDGLEVLRDHHDEIIVVISDMKMPKMNGIEFIRKAKEIYTNIIYFILTGFEYNDEIVLALRENIIHKYFTKLFNMKQIEEAIQEALVDIDRV